MLASAAEMAGRPPQELVFRDGGVEVTGSAWRVTFEELYDAGIARRYQGSYEGRAGALDAHSQGTPYDAYSFGCQLAEVEVDLRAGRIVVRRVTVAHDVGTALNPQAVEGQLQGGVVMGLGFALMEEYVPGVTRGFSGYRLPRAADVPEIRILPIASGRGGGPYGAAGIGECSLLPTAPAIINAVSAATGVRPRELPLTAARLRRLLQEVAQANE
jgi:CO/xanthine dehydrogenase Mo-binding subunit